MGQNRFQPHWYEYTGLSEVESLGWEFQAIHSEGSGGGKSEGAGLENKVSASLSIAGE